ncbi:copper resistance protein B [Thalassobaculum litoreum]|uniref:Copper resistance protein B n=1 Tax=Thalassobaculum litoreum DSM 18839 TaxID=1123362 RepID=A0A8G2BLC7_9PROT|nr:copper resistance protein B [Thalassobaculum litoreum]SDG36975.1 copper resistance protein B [Thalassobaculum litoreum DSM 18839]
MRRHVLATAALIPTLFWTAPAPAEPLIYGLQVEQAERRFDDGSDLYAWDFDALVGTDELKLIWRSEAEYLTEGSRFEKLENQLRLQTPISTFFDAVVGVRLDTPRGEDRAYGVIGVKGLAPQWFELDADLYVGETSFVRIEAEYEGLITNRITLTPSLELDTPLGDDADLGVGAFAPILEVGARLSYDLLDRAVAPYIGVHYERRFGETADLTRAEGEQRDNLFFVVGTKMLF